MIVSHRFRVAGLTVIGLVAVLLAESSPANVFAQPEEIEKPTLIRYAVPKETWVTPLKRGFQWVYQPEILDKTLPFFGYNLSKIYFDEGSVCESPDIHRYSEYDLEKAALVYQGEVYDGFPLGGHVDTGTLHTLARKVAIRKILTTKEFDIGTDFEDASKTIENFSAGFKEYMKKDEDVVESANQYLETWIPGSPAARNLMIRMIRQAKASEDRFQTYDDLSRYWIDKANKVFVKVNVQTDRSEKMLQYLANAVKNKDGKPGLTVSRICALSEFIASHQDILGNSLLLATKRPLPMVRSDIRLIGSRSLPVVTPR